MNHRLILKFPVGPVPSVFRTADEPRFLTAGAQGGNVVVWVEAAVGEAVETGVVGVFTGLEPPPDTESAYVGTAQMADGIVVHVYRRLPSPAPGLLT